MEYTIDMIIQAIEDCLSTFTALLPSVLDAVIFVASALSTSPIIESVRLSAIPELPEKSSVLR